MTALAQGTAGLALVMSFALLRTGQIHAAAILLAVQSGAVAITACVLHQPLMAIPPLVLAGAAWWVQAWLMRHPTAMLGSRTAPLGGAKLGIGTGAVLAILCQSQGGLALPSAIILLSLLFAATRRHKLMQVMALVAMQNGVVLAGSFVASPAMFPVVLILAIDCLILPLPLAAGLLIPLFPLSRRSTGLNWGSAFRSTFLGTDRVKVSSDSVTRGLRAWFLRWPARSPGSPPDDTTRTPHSTPARWLGWLDLALAVTTFAFTLVVPLDPLASTFAPLLGFDGALRSYVRRSRQAPSLVRRSFALAQTAFGIAAVCAPNLAVAWMAVLGVMATALLPTPSRRWDSAGLAFLGAGLALFGIVTLAPLSPILAYFSLFSGIVMIAAVVPELAVVLLILLLRLANQAPWPQGVTALGLGIAAIALLACALLLTSSVRPHRTTLLLLSQASIAALAICGGQADGRFAALILLILLILSQSAARISSGPATLLAMAGLAGVPPLGMFPGLVLVVLAICAHDPWLLLPLGAALVPIVLAGLPDRSPNSLQWRTYPSVAWLPLLLSLAVGYCTPDGLARWWRILTAGGT